MGMFDTVVVLDPQARLACPQGHVPHSFQTKDIEEPSFRTYLVHDGKLYLARDSELDEAAGEAWRVTNDLAVHERRYRLRELPSPRVVRVYGKCEQCAPVLSRMDEPHVWGDIVREHLLFVDYRLTFRAGEPLLIERTSGTRDDLERQLRARGLFLLDDDDPLARAHHTLKSACRQSVRRGVNGAL